MQSEQEQMQQLIKIGALVGVAVVFLLVVIFAWHSWTTKRKSEVVLHSGVTYTGPTPTGGQAPQTGDKFSVAPDTKWKSYKGEKYPYVFEAPETLQLVRLDNDPYDIYAIALGGLIPQSNVLIGVDNLKNSETLKKYVNEPKISYVENWWRQFGALTGVSSITPFTNKAGLKGYKATFTTGGGSSPVQDVFFEIASRKEIVIHLSNSVLEQSVFDRVLDSVSWEPGNDK